MKTLIKNMELIQMEDLSIEESIDMSFFYGYLECLHQHNLSKDIFVGQKIEPKIALLLKEYRIDTKDKL